MLSGDSMIQIHPVEYRGEKVESGKSKNDWIFSPWIERAGYPTPGPYAHRPWRRHCGITISSAVCGFVLAWKRYNKFFPAANYIITFANECLNKYVVRCAAPVIRAPPTRSLARDLSRKLCQDLSAKLCYTTNLIRIFLQSSYEYMNNVHFTYTLYKSHRYGFFLEGGLTRLLINHPFPWILIDWTLLIIFVGEKRKEKTFPFYFLDDYRARETRINCSRRARQAPVIIHSYQKW